MFNTYTPQQKGCFLPQRPYTTKGRAAKEVDSASRRWGQKGIITTESSCSILLILAWAAKCLCVCGVL